MPLISIIVPVYKVEAYLGKCVDSILAQTWKDFELFLVDDGSPDDCGKICDDYAKRDSRVTVIHKENGGLSDARNAALDQIHGEYIAFIDSDDYVSPEHIETLYETLSSTDSDIAIANMTSVTDGVCNEEFYCPVNEKTVLEGKDIFKTIYQPCAQAKLYKRYLYEGIRFPIGKLYEDAFIYHDVLAKAKRVCLSGRNTYYYLIRQGSILHQEYRLAFTDIIDALELRIQKLEALGLQDLADENRCFVYSRTAVAFAHLDASVAENRKRLTEVKNTYDREYPKLMRTTKSSKQKFRYWLLYRYPNLHTKLFGKKMSLALG